MNLSSLEGQELNAVCFVEQHLELRFADGPVLTLHEWPSVILPDYAISFGEPGFRDSLCAQIGEEVETATLDEGDALTVKLTNGNVLALSLREEDLSGPEAGSFSETGYPDDAEEF